MRAVGKRPRLNKETIIATIPPTMAEIIDPVDVRISGNTIADKTPKGIYIKNEYKYLFLILFLNSVNGNILGKYEVIAITNITLKTYR